MDLTPAENELATAIKFDPFVPSLVKRLTAARLERLTLAGNDLEEGEGLSVALPRKEIVRMVAELQPELHPGIERFGARAECQTA